MNKKSNAASPFLSSALLVCAASACSFQGAANGTADDDTDDTDAAVVAVDAQEFGGWSTPIRVVAVETSVGYSYDNPQFLESDIGDTFLVWSLKGDADKKFVQFSRLDGGLDPLNIFNAPLDATVPIIDSPWASLDGVVLVFAAAETNGSDTDFFVATRPFLSAAFSTVNLGWFDNINSDANESGIGLTADLLTAIYSSDVAGTDDLYIATRGSVNESFGAGVPIEALGDPVRHEGFPRITRDGLTIVFSQRETGGPSQLYLSKRETVDSTFAAPLILGELNVLEADDSSPTISSNLRQIWFASDREDPGSGIKHVYHSTRN